MTRRELFGLIVMSASGGDSRAAAILGPGGEPLIQTKDGKPVTEWGQLVDNVMADVPIGTWASLDIVVKRTHENPSRYEIDYLYRSAPAAGR